MIHHWLPEAMIIGQLLNSQAISIIYTDAVVLQQKKLNIKADGIIMMGTAHDKPCTKGFHAAVLLSKLINKVEI